MSVVTIVGITVIAAFLAVLLRRYHPEYSMAIGVITGAVVLILLLSQLAPVLGRLQALLRSASLPEEYGIILFKALGISLLAQLSSDACRDAGENAMAEKAELAGKVFLLILALPLFEKVAELAVRLMNGGEAG
ncbi:MAG: stage III sporulation protein AD [Clostridiales bacterium]|jgi:stage III sporulation protein AD|nr:stage III sporulation protein AD [Clostridiales bacterium]